MDYSERKFIARFGKRPLKKIGEGSYGRVYAWGEKAVKIWRDQDAPAELKIARLLSKCGVGPKIYCSGKLHGDTHYMIMKRLDGSLRQLKKLHGNKTEVRQQIDIQLKNLVTKMHALGVVHADLNNSNIGYTYNRKSRTLRLFIIDFGFSVMSKKSFLTGQNLLKLYAQAYRKKGITSDMIMSQGKGSMVRDRFMCELSKNQRIALKGKAVRVKNILRKIDRPSIRVRFF